MQKTVLRDSGMQVTQQSANVTLSGAVLLGAFSAFLLVFAGFPMVMGAYYTGLAGEDFPLGVLIPGLMGPLSNLFVLYVIGAALASAIAIYVLQSVQRLSLVAGCLVLLFVIAGPIAHHAGSRQKKFFTLRDPDGRYVAIIYQDPSTVIAKEIDPETNHFKPHSGVIEYPNPQRDLHGPMTPRLIVR